MVKNFTVFSLKFLYHWFILILLLKQVFNENKNEIALTINNSNTNIIDTAYYLSISEIIIDGNSANTNNYTNLLNSQQNDVIIKFKEQLTTCINMFRDLTNILYVDLSNFNSTEVKNMNNMFSGCILLKSLNINNLDTSSVTNMNNMFKNCKSLQSLNLNNLNIPLVTDMSYLFYSCNSLTSLSLNSINAPSLLNISHLFYQCTELNTLNINNTNFKSLRDISYMFYYCSSLKSLNLNKLDTSYVIDMSYMFSYCTSLISINLNHFNTLSVQYMEKMFFSCSSIKSLDLSNFNTSSVKNMNAMFSDCKSLIELNLNNFDTKTVEDINEMFNDCVSLKSLNIDNFITSSIKKMNYLFYNCKSLISLNLSNFEFNTNNCDYMFTSCNNLKYLCLDPKRIDSYKFLNSISNAIVNCTYICVDMKSKKYVEEENMCIDDCLITKNHKYEYNKICYKECPLDPDLCELYDELIYKYSKPADNTDLVESTSKMIKIDSLIENITNNSLIEKDDLNNQINDSDENIKKNKNTNLIISVIISVIVFILIIIAIIIIIIKINTKKKEKQYENDMLSQDNKAIIKFQKGITLKFSGGIHRECSIVIDADKTIGEAIDMYYEKLGIRKKGQKMFLLDGEDLEWNKNKKINDYIIKGNFDGTKIIEVHDILK